MIWYKKPVLLSAWPLLLGGSNKAFSKNAAWLHCLVLSYQQWWACVGAVRKTSSLTVTKVSQDSEKQIVWQGDDKAKEWAWWKK